MGDKGQQCVASALLVLVPPRVAVARVLHKSCQRVPVQLNMFSSSFYCTCTFG